MKECKLCKNKYEENYFQKSGYDKGVQQYKTKCKLCMWKEANSNLKIKEGWNIDEYYFIMELLIFKKINIVNEIANFINKDLKDVIDVLLNFLNMKKNTSFKLKVKSVCGNLNCNKELLIDMSKFIKHNNNFCNKQCFNSYNSKNNIENNQLKNKIIKWNLQMVKDFVEENSNCKVISDTYINGASNMEFECRCGNKFITSFFKFKDRNKRQCNTCGKENIWKNRNKATIEDIKLYVSQKNNCILLDDKYIKNNIPLKIKCECGNIFYRDWVGIRVCNILECSDCANKRNSKRQSFTHGQFIERIKEIYGDKIIPLEQYINCKTKIKCFCNICNKPFYMSGGHILEGRNCPNCTLPSKGEIIIQEYLERNNMYFVRQYKFLDCKNMKQLPFDFAVLNKDNELKCLIEFDGEQHFAVVDFFGKETGFAERVYNDAIKNAYCEDNNINLLRIPYWELKNIENILNTNLL